MNFALKSLLGIRSRKTKALDAPPTRIRLDSALPPDEPCKSGVWRGCTCKQDIAIGNERSTFDYYTTWSGILLGSALIALLLVIFLRKSLAKWYDDFFVISRRSKMRVKRGKQVVTPGMYVMWSVWRVVYIILVAAAANSLAVQLSSQLILATNNIEFYYEGTEEGAEEYATSPPGCPLTIDADLQRSIAGNDMVSHSIPIIFTLIIVAVLVKEVKRPVRSKLLLFIASLFFIVCFSLLYLSLPVKRGKDGVDVTFYEKFKEVYYNDKVPVMFSMPAYLILFLVIIIYMDH